MSMYRIDYTVLSSDTDANRRLRLSRLFTLLQEASIAHTTLLGMGRERTLDRGLLWIVTMQQANVTRLPVYDETIRLISWPGKTMHLLFPRYYRIEDKKGNALVEASALWALMDGKTRRVVFPEQYGIKIRGVHTGKEIALPAAPIRLPCTDERQFTVSYSNIDLNGHMNNTRYFDLAEDSVPAAAEGRALRSVCVEYNNEARLGEKLTVRWGQKESDWYLVGETSHTVFRLRLAYAAEAD